MAPVLEKLQTIPRLLSRDYLIIDLYFNPQQTFGYKIKRSCCCWVFFFTFHTERSQPRLFWHLIIMPPDASSQLEVFRARPTGKTHWGRPKNTLMGLFFPIRHQDCLKIRPEKGGGYQFIGVWFAPKAGTCWRNGWMDG